MTGKWEWPQEQGDSSRMKKQMSFSPALGSEPSAFSRITQEKATTENFSQLKNIFDPRESQADSVIRKFRITPSDGQKPQHSVLWLGCHCIGGTPRQFQRSHAILPVYNRGPAWVCRQRLFLDKSALKPMAPALKVPWKILSLIFFSVLSVCSWRLLSQIHSPPSLVSALLCE